MLKLLFAAFLILTFSAVPAFADGGENGSAPRFKDVRVGEAANVSRVIVVCADACAAEEDHDGSFFLSGVSGSLEVDLRGRDGFVSALTMQDLQSGAFLYIDTRTAPSAVSLAACGDTVICIDLQHPLATGILRSAAVVVPEQVPLPEIVPPTITPPSEQAAPIQTVRKASIRVGDRREEKWLPQVANAFGDLAPLPLTRELCPQYKVELQQDAWNLKAYRMVALCHAARGDLEKADTLLSELQKLYPGDELATAVLEKLAVLKTKSRKNMSLRGGS